MKNDILKTVLAGVLTIAFLTGCSGAAQTVSGAAWAGRVILPPNQTTPATVLILRAERKQETSIIAHYPRFPKRTLTDGQGLFKIESFDPAWLYDLMVVAPGCRTESFNRVDFSGEPFNAHLKAVNTSDVPPDSILRGRVMDPHGRPVPDALIRILEVTRNGMMHFSADKIDQFSVSDTAGNFIVCGQAAFQDAGGAVEASGLATGLFEGWAPSDRTHELTLIEGASLQGKLLHEGKPAANAEICLDRFGAEAGSPAWSTTSITDTEGRFSFEHLPPNRNCRLHGRMGSLSDLGAVPTRGVRIPENGSTNDLGSLNLEPTFSVDGRIRLTDGKSVPADSILYFGSFDLGMSSQFPVGENGGFRLTGCPAGSLPVYLQIPGYELTPGDALLKLGSTTNLTVAFNVTGLVIEMHPRTRR